MSDAKRDRLDGIVAKLREQSSVPCPTCGGETRLSLRCTQCGEPCLNLDCTSGRVPGVTIDRNTAETAREACEDVAARRGGARGSRWVTARYFLDAALEAEEAK